MSIQSVLVEYENCDEQKVYANSGCLISNKYVLTTSNILITLFKDQKTLKTELKNLKPGLLPSEILLNSRPEVNVIIKNENNVLYKRGKVIAIYVSDYIKNEAGKFFNDWSIDDEIKGQDLKEILSLFFIVGIDIVEEKDIFKDIILNLQELCRISQANELKIGDKIIVEGTPFGNRHFLKSRSRGIVSNVFGKKNCFILSDTPTGPGSEGCPMFLKLRKEQFTPIGIVLVSLSWCKGEWIGLTLGATYSGVFSTIAQFETNIHINPDNSLISIHRVMNNCLVQVVSGAAWGSGVLLNKEKGIFITNSHVVENDFPVLYWNNAKIRARVVYKTPENEIYDIAVLLADLKALKRTSMESIMISTQRCSLGETVFAIGFPLFPRTLGLKPTVTKGHVSQVTTNMIKTTCSILPGASGGGIIKKNGELVGLIVCNARLGDNSIVPRVNMSIPIVNILDVLENYIKTDDADVLQTLRRHNLLLQKEWNFIKCNL